MSRAHRVFLAGAFALLHTAAAQAQPALCRAVSDDKKRLECYDRATEAPAKPAPKPIAGSNEVVVTTEMNAYASDLDQRLLKAGITMNVFVVSKRSRGLPPVEMGYPSLHFFGYLDRAAIYAIVDKLMAGSFADAKSLGFLTVEFQDNGSRGTYRFDLRTPGQACARDLCFR